MDFGIIHGLPIRLAYTTDWIVSMRRKVMVHLIPRFEGTSHAASMVKKNEQNGLR